MVFKALCDNHSLELYFEKNLYKLLAYCGLLQVLSLSVNICTHTIRISIHSLCNMYTRTVSGYFFLAVTEVNLLCKYIGNHDISPYQIKVEKMNDIEDLPEEVTTARSIVNPESWLLLVQGSEATFLLRFSGITRFNGGR